MRSPVGEERNDSNSSSLVRTIGAASSLNCLHTVSRPGSVIVVFCGTVMMLSGTTANPYISSLSSQGRRRNRGVVRGWALAMLLVRGIA